MDSIYGKRWFKFATYWVAGYVLFFILVVGVVQSGVNLGVGFLVLMGIHLVTMLLSVALTVLYLVHAIRNPYLEAGSKVLWGLLFLSCGPFAMPFYYQRHLTRA